MRTPRVAEAGHGDQLDAECSHSGSRHGAGGAALVSSCRWSFRLVKGRTPEKNRFCRPSGNPTRRIWRFSAILECDSNELECTEHDQDTFLCHGNICRSPMAEFIMKDLVKKAGLEQSIQIESAATSTEGDRQPGLSADSPQAVRAWHRLFRQTSPAASEQRLREVRPSDWHGSGQPAEYVPDLRRRFCPTRCTC